MSTGVYPNIPQYIDPVAFSFGSVSVYWYGLAYLAAFGAGSLVFWHASGHGPNRLSSELRLDLLSFVLFGTLLGARLGYVFFYYPSFYAEHPWAVVLPFDPATGDWTGIAGMSYYGGLLGASLSLAWFARIRRLSFLRLADLAAFAAPAGYFFGRIGNFLNGELFGRPTDGPWGMRFPLDGTGGVLSRHPSQLYEAFVEGFFLFAVLSVLRGRNLFPGGLAACSVAGYAFLRFWLEYFREPDFQSGLLLGGLTLGQWLSVLFFSAAAAFLWIGIRRYAKVGM
jgi:phosphatidylglycerol:prolipoprotein diacylglycerol transferase